MKIIIIGILFYNSAIFFSQNIIQLKGKILDSNKDYISFCPLQIGLISTVSNQIGEFELNIPENKLNDTIYVSYIGFYSQKIAAKKLYKNSVNEIILFEHQYNLNEVIVRPTFTPEQIINNITLNFSRNYRAKPYNLSGFFRNYVKENKKYDKLIEGEINIHSSGFNLKAKELTESEIYLNECRTSYSSGIHQEINTVNNLIALFTRSENIYKILFNEKYLFNVDKYEYRGDDKVIYLSFTRPDVEIGLYYSGYFIINEKTWGIEQIIYNKTDLNNSKNIYKQSQIDSIKLKHINDLTTVNFLYINNHYELSYMKMDYTNELISPNTKILVSTITEYITNDYSSNSRKKGKKMKKNGTLIKQTYNMPYHEKYWRNYNYLIDNKELEKVKKDINEAKFNN